MPIGTYTPPPCKIFTQIFFSNFFHFRCILLQIGHKKCFFISISILGRSRVNSTFRVVKAMYPSTSLTIVYRSDPV